jgi:hypothetical protein
MATVESRPLTVLEARHHGDGDVVSPTLSIEHGHIRVVEEKKPGTSECVSIQCNGNVEENGRVAMFHTRRGIEALITFDITARGIALSFGNGKGNHVDISHLAGHGANPLEESSYAGRLTLRNSGASRNYEFDSRIAGLGYTARSMESSIMRFLLMAGTGVIGSFKMEPSCLDISIREDLQAREEILLLGIAFSIWRLIPCS